MTTRWTSTVDTVVDHHQNLPESVDIRIDWRYVLTRDGDRIYHHVEVTNVKGDVLLEDGTLLEIKSFTFTESGGRYDLDQEKYYFEPWNVFINEWLNAEVSL